VSVHPSSRASTGSWSETRETRGTEKGRAPKSSAGQSSPDTCVISTWKKSRGIVIDCRPAAILSPLSLVPKIQSHRLQPRYNFYRNEELGCSATLRVGGLFLTLN